ncbi:uncharacterized protein LOC110448069 [Mizuhopecten yessoensis]|uniref:uncharacterized protein LOC110448069 n=1 Tax=Mizuhopecten yessoensis TaxID=6573 RepID=UPI000B45B3E8|nr:uncharacterized protein LOC110448069 [Mizuhopecten yessoensis]
MTCRGKCQRVKTVTTSASKRKVAKWSKVCSRITLRKHYYRWRGLRAHRPRLDFIDPEPKARGLYRPKGSMSTQTHETTGGIKKKPRYKYIWDAKQEKETKLDGRPVCNKIGDWSMFGAGVATKEKRETWRQIANAINASSTISRSVEKVEMKWHNLQMKGNSAVRPQVIDDRSSDLDIPQTSAIGSCVTSTTAALPPLYSSICSGTTYPDEKAMRQEKLALESCKTNFLS